MRGNKERKSSEYGHFSRGVIPYSDSFVLFHMGAKSNHLFSIRISTCQNLLLIKNVLLKTIFTLIVFEIFLFKAKVAHGIFETNSSFRVKWRTAGKV